MGTLSTDGHRTALQRLRSMALAAGKRTYTFLVGRPTVTKLGNFPEVDVFVMVADEGGQILDCKDYLAPIVTPCEAALAWGAEDCGGAFAGLRLGFDHLLGEVADVEVQAPAEAEEDAIVARGASGLTTGGIKSLVEANSAAEYFLQQRTYKGLETPTSGAARKEGAAAVPGRVGRAAGYTHENTFD